MPQFRSGEEKVAMATFATKPAGLACVAELWLRRDTSKVATSGEIAFTSTGADQSISLPITMPGEGIYGVHLDIHHAGVFIGAYKAVEDVTITPVTPEVMVEVEQITWNTPQFMTGEPKTATVAIKSLADARYVYNATLYLGDKATEATAKFDLRPGESKDIEFEITMPTKAGNYPVYIDVTYRDQIVGRYEAVEPITVVLGPYIIDFSIPDTIKSGAEFTSSISVFLPYHEDGIYKIILQLTGVQTCNAFNVTAVDINLYQQRDAWVSDPLALPVYPGGTVVSFTPTCEATHWHWGTRPLPPGTYRAMVRCAFGYVAQIKNGYTPALPGIRDIWFTDSKRGLDMGEVIVV